MTPPIDVSALAREVAVRVKHDIAEPHYWDLETLTAAIASVITPAFEQHGEDERNTGASIAAQKLREIAEGKPHSGVYGGEAMEAAAQAVLSLRAAIAQSREDHHKLGAWPDCPGCVRAVAQDMEGAKLNGELKAKLAERDAKFHAVRRERDALVTAAQSLVLKLDAIHADPAYQSVFTLAHVRGSGYRGPTYGPDLEVLRDVLTTPPAPPAAEEKP